jgi:hypothetical protein
MRHVIVIYLALCALIPFMYQTGPIYFDLFDIERDVWYFTRDVLAISGCTVVTTISYEKNEIIRKKLVKIIVFQAIFQLAVLLYNDCAYDPWGNFVNAAVIIGSIYYIYHKNKPDATKRS